MRELNFAWERMLHGGWLDVQWNFSEGLIHHSDGGGQYLPIRYAGHLRDAGIEPLVGSIGDCYDNALAESIIGLYKAEVIRRRGLWLTFEAVEFATLEWVDRLSTVRFCPFAPCTPTLVSPASDQPVRAVPDPSPHRGR